MATPHADIFGKPFTKRQFVLLELFLRQKGATLDELRIADMSLGPKVPARSYKTELDNSCAARWWDGLERPHGSKARRAAAFWDQGALGGSLLFGGTVQQSHHGRTDLRLCFLDSVAGRECPPEQVFL